MTVLEDIYEKYESFRNSPTAKEHANLFIAWMLTRKEELIEKERQQIIDAAYFGLGQIDQGHNQMVQAENYYESIKINN